MLLEQLYTFYESFNDWSHATLTPGKRWINISPVLTFEGWQIGSNFIHGQYLSIIFSSWELWIVGISQQSWGNIGKLSFANLNPPQKKAGQRQAPAARGSWKPQKGRVTVVRCLKASSKMKLYWSLKIGIVVGLSTVEMRLTALI